jgi:hypothetical protein
MADGRLPDRVRADGAGRVKEAVMTWTYRV